MNLRSLAQTSLDAFRGRPALVESNYATTDSASDLQSGVFADLRRLAGADIAAEVASWEARKLSIVADYGMAPGAMEKVFAFADGIAIIPVHGILINRFSQSWGFVTGYNFIRNQFMAAMADTDVKLIAFDVNSYGGMAAGCQELSQEIYDARKDKPSVAIVDFNCYSAAYYIASAAQKVIATPSSGIGSIGALAMRTDITNALDQAGIKITVVYAGANKLDSQPVVPFSKDAKARLQAAVDLTYDAFVGAVVRNRGMTDAEVRGTEASCYDAQAALDLGLIDSIQPPAAALESAVDDMCNPDNEDDDEMSVKPEAGGNAAAPPPATGAPALTVADINAAVATALSADRDRRSAILALPEAVDRPKLAAHLANTEMTPDMAKSVLAAAAVETKPDPAKPGNPLETAMAATQQPNVTAEGGAAPAPGAKEETSSDKAKRILAAQTAATGVKLGGEATKH